MSKTIISFDIGIKNLAYCIFVIDPAQKTSILKWNIVNLTQTAAAAADGDSHPKCTCMKVGKKKAPDTVCGKKGAFTDSTGETVFCTVHAKVLSATHLNTPKDSTAQVPCTNKIIPCKEMSMSTIKSLKLDDLKTFCKTHSIAFTESDKKPDICAKAETAIKARTLVPIKPVKKNANHVHLVEIGKQIRIQMDQILKVQRTDGSEGPLKNITVDIVILENQISPIAGRMNTIQGMLAQYFIMRPDISLIPKIEFISSSGKLKDYKGSKGPSGGKGPKDPTVPKELKEPSSTDEKTTTSYKDHKRDGIAFCRDFMTKNEGLRTHQNVLETSTKKDDLADCFLQGIYYLKREKLITYSEDLEIKVV
jgi:hypothetical protein